MPAQVFSSLFYSLFFLFVFPFSILTSLIVKTNSFTGVNAFVVISNSMYPTVPVGSVIYTDKVSQYKKGDIISFLQNGKTISHRVSNIVRVGSALYYATKGDANKISDFDLVSQEYIRGKTVFFLPYVGIAVIAVRNIANSLATIPGHIL